MKVVDNLQKAAKFKVYLPVMLNVILILLLWGFFGEFYLKIYNKIVFSIAAALFLFYVVLVLSRKHYFSLEVDHKNIKIKFFNPHPFFTKYKSILIPIKQFDTYEIKYKFFGVRRDIIFYIRKGNSKGAYPPVSISLLSKEEISKLKKELNALIKMKKL